MLTTPPLRRSALHHRLLAAGVRMGPFQGWERAESVGDAAGETRSLRAGVALADLSARFQLLIQGTGLADWLPSCPAVGWVELLEAGVCCRLTDDRALVLTARPFEPRPPAGVCVHVTDLTSGRTIVAVAGPDSLSVLRAVTQLELSPTAFPDRRCAQTSVAGVAATLLRRDRLGVPVYEILVARDLGEHLWDCLLDAGTPLHAALVGAAVLEQGD